MLEFKKKKLERMKVECAKEEMSMRIMEAEENIERLKLNMAIQEKRMAELDKEIKEYNKE